MVLFTAWSFAMPVGEALYFGLLATSFVIGSSAACARADREGAAGGADDAVAAARATAGGAAGVAAGGGAVCDARRLIKLLWGFCNSFARKVRVATALTLA